ncbi:MAG: diaminopimelate decarboxylase [Burkholderiales bacterium]|mgnify:CR=1 FL=1|nr:diaminopimelate decarboxylase [Burkholderiales bacterium]OUT80048.1 MAG: diaminopimelate decarboxylase [Betaproteobacteria bacterium TMED22]|tara:strand:- start:27382 stop:28626 length:1245 start_codon:yes stop_codon:yes gene_type:complete
MTINTKTGRLYIENRAASDIAEEFGTPCYVYSKNSIETNFNRFKYAFGERKNLVCYAVKANSNIAIINILAQLGSGFDIVSGGELSRVLAAGGDASKIVFSGVGKTHAEINYALEQKIKCFNVESESELYRISNIAKELNVDADISLRVNPDVDAKTHPYISTGMKENKFGVDVEDATRLYKTATDLPNISPTGIDCHIGSQLTDIAPMRDAALKMVELTDALIASNIEIKHIDFGGGLGIQYEDETPIHQEQFVEMLLEVMGGREQEILVEPGRSIVGNSGVLLTTVEYLKHGSNKNFIVVDAAMNDLARPSLYNAYHHIDNILDKEKRPLKRYDIVGPICETGDFLGKDRELSVNEGDVLAIHSVGAYGMTMSSNYNSRVRVPEILIDDTHAHVIRKKESVEELFSNEQIAP